MMQKGGQHNQESREQQGKISILFPVQLTEDKCEYTGNEAIGPAHEWKRAGKEGGYRAEGSDGTDYVFPHKK